MSERKRLHPISALSNFLKQLKELLLPFVILFVFGGNGGEGGIWRFIAAGVFVLIVLINGILSWLRFTYRIEEGELRIESGVFVRKKRYIPFERIQSLDFSEGVLQRPFGLVQVKVETAGSSGIGKAEAVLTAITKEEAKAIQDILSSVKNGRAPVTEEKVQKTEMIYQISMTELFILATTSGGAGVIISAVIAFVLQFDEVIPYERVFNEFRHIIANGVIFVSMIVLLVVVVAWIAAFIGTMFKYANFTLQKVDDDFVISRGLIEKRQMTIPIHRIQGIRICENLIRQPFGLATVYVESAGGSQGKESSSRVLILPVLKKNKIAQYLQPYLPDYQFELTIEPVPKRAFKRYLFRNSIIPLVMILLCLILLRPWGYLSLVIIPLVYIWSFLKYKDAGWVVNNNAQLTLRYRGIIKNTILMKKNKIQSLSFKRSYFQKRKKLATLSAVIKSGVGGSGGSVVDVEEQDGITVYNWYKS